MTAPPISPRGPIVAVGAHMQGLWMRVDRIPGAGETVLGPEYWEPRDGGKVANAAVAAARLGSPVAIVTIIGTDARGDDWLRYFGSQGIDVSGVRRVDGTTDVGVVLLPPDGIPAIASIAVLSRHLTASVVREAAETTIGAASIVLCALESPAEGIAEALRIGRSAGAFTILNPSPAEAMREDLYGPTDLLVLNQHEAVQLAGRRGSPGSLGKVLVDIHGLHAAVVTAGAEGAFLARPGSEPLRFPAPQVKAVDTTGAGDGFLGGLAASLHGGAPLEAAIAFAVRVSAASVTKRGTMEAYPSADEVGLRPDIRSVPSLDARMDSALD